MNDDITIATIALAAPIRRYRVEAILRRKPDLEAPAEACLKVLSVAERLSESALTRYLGLAPEEFDLIAAELLGQALVRRSGPDLMLTERGARAVDPDAEGQRREETTVTLAFEDSAFAEAPRGRARPWMRRMTPSEVRQDGRPEAAQAFREGFAAWKARERKGEHGDTLARVVNVAPIGRDSATIKAPVSLASTSDAAYIDVSKLGLGSLTSEKRREACAERFRETVIGALSPKDGASAIEWIKRVVAPIPGAPEVDPVDWARRARSGVITAPENCVLVSETAPSLIARSGLVFDSGITTEEEFVIGEDVGTPVTDVVLWSPPEGEAWRLDADIEVAASQLSREMNEVEGQETGLVAAVLRLRKGEEKDIKSLWSLDGGSGPFGAALLATSPRSENAPLAHGISEEWPQALELVVRPGMWALAIAHLTADRAHIPIPVGIATEDPVVVNRVMSAFREKIAFYENQDWCAPRGSNWATRAAKHIAEEAGVDHLRNE